MLFSELADACLDPALVPAVKDLLSLKMNTPEFGEGKRIDVINNYLDASIEEIEEFLKKYPSDDPKSWDELNTIFLQNLRCL